MPLSYSKNKVFSNDHIVDNIYLMKVKIDAKINPGQFYMLRGWGCEPILPRPISVNDYEDGTLSFLYMVCGTGTKHLKNLKENDPIELLGPLGNGFPIEKLTGKIAVVAGGIGIAPMLHTIKNLNAKNIDVYVGFRENSYGIEEIRGFSDNVFVYTDTGAEGKKGYCTDDFEARKYDVVITCGPEIMMRKVAELCNSENVDCYLSTEKHMACGIGACLVCSCKTKDGNKRACKDGPVFLSKDVIFDE